MKLRGVFLQGAGGGGGGFVLGGEGWVKRGRGGNGGGKSRGREEGEWIGMKVLC